MMLFERPVLVVATALERTGAHSSATHALDTTAGLT
jgi:hypothetical protein